MQQGYLLVMVVPMVIMDLASLASATWRITTSAALVIASLFILHLTSLYLRGLAVQARQVLL